MAAGGEGHVESLPIPPELPVAMMTAAELHKWITEYNWDDGVAPIRQVVEEGEIEFATALLVYWRLGGPYLDPGSGAVNAEAWKLSQAVKYNGRGFSGA